VENIVREAKERTDKIEETGVANNGYLKVLNIRTGIEKVYTTRSKLPNLTSLDLMIDIILSDPRGSPSQAMRTQRLLEYFKRERDGKLFFQDTVIVTIKILRNTGSLSNENDRNQRPYFNYALIFLIQMECRYMAILNSSINHLHK